MSILIDRGDLTPHVFDAISIALIALTAVFAIIRCWSSWHLSKRLFADDYLSVLAVIFQAAAFAIYHFFIILLAQVASAAPITKESGRIIVAQAFIAGIALWIAKAPILVLFVRIFGIKRWVRAVSYTTIATTFIVFIGALIPVGVKCSPDGKVLDAQYLAGCLPNTLNVGLAHGVTALFTDVTIFIIPLPVIFSLNLSWAKRFGLLVVFVTGLAGIVASAISLYYKIVNFQGKASLTIVPILLTEIEIAIAILVASVPALRAFWSQELIHLGLYSRLRSAVSSILTRKSSDGSSQTDSGVALSGIVTDRTIRQRFEYVEVDDSREIQAAYIVPNSISERYDRK
ncbi:hypothetical protein F5Y10DRAFT_255622 [Nemania abortiva]|nr:hypothetical protein F5Y10DRAFT_255622 [Nemania abortiva]